MIIFRASRPVPRHESGCAWTCISVFSLHCNLRGRVASKIMTLVLADHDLIRKIIPSVLSFRLILLVVD